VRRLPILNSRGSHNSGALAGRPKVLQFVVLREASRATEAPSRCATTITMWRIPGWLEKCQSYLYEHAK
jgi:hypothetical protein